MKQTPLDEDRAWRKKSCPEADSPHAFDYLDLDGQVVVRVCWQCFTSESDEDYRAIEKFLTKRRTKKYG